jgi:hypothetical protein
MRRRKYLEKKKKKKEGKKTEKIKYRVNCIGIQFLGRNYYLDARYV